MQMNLEVGGAGGADDDETQLVMIDPLANHEFYLSLTAILVNMYHLQLYYRLVTIYPCVNS